MGGAALWALYKAWQAKQESTSQQFCIGACGSDTTCIASCGVIVTIGEDIGQVLNEANPFYNGQNHFSNGLQSDVTNNNTLNGAIAIGNTVGGDTQLNPLMGPALMYANGCQPFSDAFGWSKCAPGTLDMYSDGVISRHGGVDETTNEAGEAGELTQHLGLVPFGAGIGYQDQTTSPPTDGSLNLQPINKDGFMGGQQGDPTTFGPWGPPGSPWAMYVNQTSDQYADLQNLSGRETLTQTAAESAIGPWTWMTRGQRTTCPDGQVPKTVLLGVNGITNPDPIGTEACVSQTGGSDLCVNGQPPPGFSWNPSAGVWVRATSGQAINPGPCVATTGTGGVGLGGTITGVVGGSNGVTAGGGGLSVDGNANSHLVLG